MRLPRRSMALILTMFLGQLVLTGHGYGCVGHGGEGVGNRVDSSVQSHGGHGGTTGATLGATASHDGCTENVARLPCSLPGTELGCTSMATCGTIAMNADRSARGEPRRLTSGVADAVFDSAPTRTIAPELPPPRA